MTRLLTALLALSACSSAPRPSALDRPASDPPEFDLHRTVAYYNGESLSWMEVAGTVMKVNLHDAVEKYVLWRIVRDRVQALGITHTPDEMMRRAQVAVDQYRKTVGAERFAAELQQRSSTEEALARDLQTSPNLAETFALEKVVVYDSLKQDPPLPYTDAAPRVVQRILENPPSQEDLRGWLDLQYKRSLIEYEDRRTPGN